MGITLPNSGDESLSQVPTSLSSNNKVVYEYLQSLRQDIAQLKRNLFENDLTLANAVNLGTSGTFTISSGGSIIVTSGIVITVTS